MADLFAPCQALKALEAPSQHMHDHPLTLPRSTTAWHQLTRLALLGCVPQYEDNGRSMFFGSQKSIFEPKNAPLIPPRYTVARMWTYETVCALGIEDTSLSWNEEWFGPRYRLESNIEDMNAFLEQVWINALEHLNGAPSVGMHDVPRESLLAHLGFGKESDTQDKLDERTAGPTHAVRLMNPSDEGVIVVAGNSE
ncbi:hypothetical protein ARMGADRAFT_1089525 [Armillaria gallica]|uniref:Uncharacterized protein n=1 Tax=Armillaria gallica TaxID=47427 RepID=A0A2H3D313_ARMGA|nr:hypothetical protein ARMGADRAFT_1089525 [Armillaria gallica]